MFAKNTQHDQATEALRRAAQAAGITFASVTATAAGVVVEFPTEDDVVRLMDVTLLGPEEFGCAWGTTIPAGASWPQYTVPDADLPQLLECLGAARRQALVAQVAEGLAREFYADLEHLNLTATPGLIPLDDAIRRARELAVETAARFESQAVAR